MNKNEIKKMCLVLLSETVSDMSDSSDSSDECVRKKIPRIQDFVEVTVKQFDATIFQQHFRMQKYVAYKLIDKMNLDGFIPKHSGGALDISCEKSLLMTLWYLGNTETFRQISDRFDVSFSTAHRCIIRVINFLLTLKKTVIKWPNENEKIKLEVEFRKKQNIAGVIGAIDGSHIKISKPKINQDSYINRKGYHSVILQAVADPSKMFLDVYCGEPGSLHDARVLKRSKLYEKAQDPAFFGKYHLLGDSAYPCMDWLITPFKDTGHLTQNEKIFNFKHSSTRIIVENTFGLLKGRFRRLMYLWNLDINICVKIILAACILHNLCIMAKMPEIDNDLICNNFQQAEVIPRINRMLHLFNEMFK